MPTNAVKRSLLVLAALATSTIVTAATTPADLAGIVWLWEFTERGDRTRVVADDPSRYTVRFGDNLALRVQADCNGGSGRYTARPDGGLTLSAIATTKKGCPKGSQDREFLDGFSNVTAYKVEGNTLDLSLSDGGTMRFFAGR